MRGGPNVTRRLHCIACADDATTTPQAPNYGPSAKQRQRQASVYTNICQSIGNTCIPTLPRSQPAAAAATTTFQVVQRVADLLPVSIACSASGDGTGDGIFTGESHAGMCSSFTARMPLGPRPPRSLLPPAAPLRGGSRGTWHARRCGRLWPTRCRRFPQRTSVVHLGGGRVERSSCCFFLRCFLSGK